MLGALAKIAGKVANVGANLIKGILGVGEKIPKGHQSTEPIDYAALDSSTKVLGLIYMTMQRAREAELADRIQNEKDHKDKLDDENKRNDELIKALTVRRKPKKKKKEEPKEEPKKEEKKKPPTKKEEEVKKEAPPKAEPAPKKEVPPKAEVKKAPEKVPTKEAVKEKPKKTEPVPKEEKAPPKAEKEPIKEIKESAKPAKPEKVSPVKPGTIPKISSESDIKDMIIANEGKGLPGKPGQPYKDSKGLWTIGVGHLIGDGKTLPPEWNRTLSDNEMKELFEKDFEKHKKLAEKFPNFKNLNLSGQAALIDLAFNIPISLKWPVFNKQLADMDLEGAAKNLEGTLWYTQVASRAPKTVGLLRNGAGVVPPNQALPSTLAPSTGTKIDQASKENKDMKDAAANTKKQQTVNNTTINQTNSQSSSTSSDAEFDDRNPQQKKKG